jgi:predicted amidohydrolase
MNKKENFKIALIQLKVGFDKLDNLKRATYFINKSAENGANIVVLPVIILMILKILIDS